jgi:hypothetical protein
MGNARYAKLEQGLSDARRVVEEDPHERSAGRNADAHPLKSGGDIEHGHEYLGLSPGAYLRASFFDADGERAACDGEERDLSVSLDKPGIPGERRPWAGRGKEGRRIEEELRPLPRGDHVLRVGHFILGLGKPLHAIAQERLDSSGIHERGPEVRTAGEMLPADLLDAGHDDRSVRGGTDEGPGFEARLFDKDGER